MEIANEISTTSNDIISSFLKSLDNSLLTELPYKHWFLRQCLPHSMAQDIKNLPFPAPSVFGVSGKRELHNATRKYFNKPSQEQYPCVSLITEAFQDERVTSRLSNFFQIDLNGSYLRVEYAQDTHGFWLEPHTDLGVKLFTMLLYLSDEEGHETLGTDIYDNNKKHVARSPFESNSAMVFIPSHKTYHGFEPRLISGVRKSLIINYVTNEWRAREQLANAEQPILTSSYVEIKDLENEQSSMDWAWGHGISHGGAYSSKRRA